MFGHSDVILGWEGNEVTSLPRVRVAHRHSDIAVPVRVWGSNRPVSGCKGPPKTDPTFPELYIEGRVDEKRRGALSGETKLMVIRASTNSAVWKTRRRMTRGGKV